MRAALNLFGITGARLSPRHRERSHLLKRYSINNKPLKLNPMFEDLKDKAAGLMENENVKEVVEKATEFISTDKGKEIIETVKEKAEEFIKDKFGK